MGNHEDAESGIKFEREYNQICGKMLQEEREKRGISREELARGILSKTALGHMETGRIGWTKLPGDTLMHRMGVGTDYFEVVASAEELDRWRRREDICLLLPARPGEAVGKLREYRHVYGKREPLEEQFLCKAEALLALLDWRRDGEEADAARLSDMARRAVHCTVPEGWERGMEDLWLAPSELEAVLLEAAARMVRGREEEAWELWQAVRRYPKAHHWRERVEALIAPQTAMLGIWLSLQGRRGIGQPVFAFAREALEMLRRNNSHSYLLPLLELMGRMRPRDGGEAAYLEQAAEFREAFRRLYEWFGYPGYRIWQGISVDNTREIGVVLRMLRKCEGKSRARAIHDEEGIIVTERQLEKIEKGVHKPSYENYQRLMRQYGKCGGWKTAMVEADSVEVLELRQQISTLIRLCEWDRVWIEIERFRRKVDAAYPRVRQELLFWEALMKWKKDGALEEALETLFQALHCTVPPEEGRDLKWWVFEREESIIASNIASVYRRLGRLEEAGKWFDTVMFSLEQQRGRTGIAHSGYGILMDGYDNYLDDRGCLKTAVKMNEETICNCLKWPLIDSVASMLYRYAWNSYEIASKEPKLFDVLRPKWNNAFRLCQSLVRFRYDYNFEEFLQVREAKFLP